MSKASKIILALGSPFIIIIFAFIIYMLSSFIVGDAEGLLSKFFDIILFVLAAAAIIAFPVGIVVAIVVGLSSDSTSERKD